MPEYELFLVKGLEELKDGEEQVLNIRDSETYETRTVKALITSSPEKLPDGNVLWIRWQRGYKHPQPWAIKVLQEQGTLGETVAKDYY